MRQFEPAEVRGFVEVQVDPGEKPEQVFIKAKKFLREQVDDEANKLKIERKESFNDEDGLEKST